MKKLRNIFQIIAVLLAFSCEDRYYKKRFDIEYSITNRTNRIIREIKVNGNNGARVWIFKDVNPGNTAQLRFNIRRDLGGPDGNLSITAFLNGTDSLYLGAAYYSNWYYFPTDPTEFDVYENRIVARK